MLALATVSALLTACDDDLDIKQAYAFHLAGSFMSDFRGHVYISAMFKGTAAPCQQARPRPSPPQQPVHARQSTHHGGLAPKAQS